MTLPPWLLVAVALAYLAMLSVIALVTDRVPAAARWSRHPLVGALSLGAYATSWSYHGSVGFAAAQGWRFLAIYLGVTLSCALIPVLWRPILRLVRERQLTSLADLLAFRYHSQAVGVAVTLFILIGSLPYQALQLRAIVETVAALGGSDASRGIGLITSLVLIWLAATFGARHLRPRRRHDGLVLAIAVESVVKLAALLAVAAFAVWGVLGSRGGVTGWLEAHPTALVAMATPARDGSWVALLLLSAAAAFLLPRTWHLAFTEAADQRGLATAAWALPVYLLLLSIAVPPVLWAGQALALGGDPDFHVIAVTAASDSPVLAAVVFLGGLSAASAMILLTAIALASMCHTHLVLPLGGVGTGGDLYRRLLWTRRVLIAAIVMAGYGMYVVLRHRHGLADLGLIAFVAIAQLVPGVIGVLFWPRATRAGLLAGLGVGATVWATTLMAPLLASAGLIPDAIDLLAALGLGDDPWSEATALSVGGNALVFAAVSLRWPQRAAEAEAAARCRGAANLAAVAAISPDEIVARLAPLLGAEAASREVAQGLVELGLGRGERRVAQLRRLRDRVEQNLSGLVGPVLARAALDDGLTAGPSAELVSAQLQYLDEQRAAALEGPARELDAARRYLRQVLEDLPLGVCTIDPVGDVVLWNATLARATGIAPADAVGRSLAALAAPWGPPLAGFAAGDRSRDELELAPGGATRVVALGRSTLAPGALPGGAGGGTIILVEDRTEQRALEARVTHQDRLASIGRVAAGVAHEVGNPLTGIASVAQNLIEETDDPEVAGRLELVLASTRRIDRIVRALVAFSHHGNGSGHAPVAIAEVIADAVTLVRLCPSRRAVDVVVDVAADLWVRGDPQRLEQVVINLLSNACDASPPGARVEIRGDRAGPSVRFGVVDRGAGMPPEIRARAFEPFVTTKPPGQGTGLGLAVAYSIVVEHGGTIAIDSVPGAGTAVWVTLP